MNQKIAQGNELLIHKERLSAIVEKIIMLKNPNKICLVNSLSSVCYFTNNKLPDEIVLQSHYNLLVVITETDELYEVQDVIENNCKAIAPLTTLVLTQSYYHAFLIQNAIFAKSVLVTGQLLYEKPNSACATLTGIQLTKDLNKESKEGFKRANGFLSSAELLLLTNEIPLAAFMLHQAIEQYCYGNILGHLGINPKTHNLDKLYRLMRFFTFELIKVFPRDTETEERLFGAVKDAYIASRYSSSCTYKSSDLKTVRDRLRILFKV